MVITVRKKSGFTTTELILAIAILTIAMLPLAFSFAQEQKLARSSYQRAIAMEIVDGEMEILMAGEWHTFKDGAQPYAFHSAAATNLPPGKATLCLRGKHLRLEWLPDQKSSRGGVLREADAP